MGVREESRSTAARRKRTQQPAARMHALATVFLSPQHMPSKPPSWHDPDDPASSSRDPTLEPLPNLIRMSSSSSSPSGPGRRRSLFRPCIDLHSGLVKQIVGGTLTDGDDNARLRTNYVSP